MKNPQNIRSIFLSPHPDDAALSCGGTIYSMALNDQRPIVITLFGGDRPSDAPLSDFVRSLHARWQLNDDDAPALRRAEDRAGLDRLHAFVIFLPFADAVYRIDPATKRHLYDSEETIFGSIQEADITDRVAAALRSKIATIKSSGSTVQVFVPLTAGQHVDHQIAREAAERLNENLIYYEDFPYAEDITKLQLAWGNDEWQAESIELRAEALSAKIESIAQYRSQLSSFFKDEGEIETRLKAYAKEVGDGQLVERYWRKV
jgi:LmbE family N-acetylglucosaminyl deacetylase